MRAPRFLWITVVLATPVLADEKKPAGETAPVKVAHFKLSGSMDEAPVGEDPLLGATSENFQTKLDRLNKAINDKSVGGLFLHLDGMNIGWGRVNELTKVIKRAREAGKKTFAYLEGGSTHDFIVGLACDQVCMPQSGTLMLTGLQMEMTFFKELFEKLSIKADMLKMGNFKGAAEPYTRNNMSPDLRKQLTGFLDDMFEHDLVGRIVETRKDKNWTAAFVKRVIDDGPYTATEAKKVGLLDEVAYTDELPGLFKKAMKSKKIEIVKDYGKADSKDLDLSNPLAILKLFASPKKTPSKNPKIAVIYAVGVINTGKGGRDLLNGATVGSTTMVKAIEQADKDSTVKAIVLRVDSPGGSALASDLIWNALRKCKKPVIASMGDTAASGGYYISMAASKIYAEPGTLTGSIGVVGGKIAIEGLFEKVGITSDVISRGKNAGILSTGKPFTPTQRKAMQTIMEDVYDQFLNKALEGRKKAGKNMSLAILKNLAGGRIWTGRQALQHDLVDELGTLEDAIADAKKRANLTEKDKTELLTLPKPRSLIDSLMEGLPGLSLSISKSPLLREAASRLGSLEGVLQLRKEPVWLMMPYHLRVK